jgi:hypothetical protein
VRAVEGEVAEERAVLVLANEVDGGIGDDIGDVAVLFDGLAIVLQDRIEVTLAAGRVGRLADAAALEHQSFLEALIHGAQRITVAEVPLAEDAGTIAETAQDLGERRFIGVHHRAADERIDDAGAIIVAAGHQAGARRGADGRDVEVLHAHALLGELVDIRRPDDRVAVDAKIAVALIVGDDDNDIGFLPLRRLRSRDRREVHQNRHGNRIAREHGIFFLPDVTQYHGRLVMIMTQTAGDYIKIPIHFRQGGAEETVGTTSLPLAVRMAPCER